MDNVFAAFTEFVSQLQDEEYFENDPINGLTINTNPVASYNQINHAAKLSEMWKTRAKNMFKDIKVLERSLIEMVDEIDDETQNERTEQELVSNQNQNESTQEEGFQKLAEIMMDIDWCMQSMNSLEKVMNVHGPLSYDNVIEISAIEQDLYEMIMTAENYAVLLRQYQENFRVMTKLNGMYNSIDQMWDSNISEDQIKEFIKTQLKDIYDGVYPALTENDLAELTTTIFLEATGRKPVRVCLSEEQIADLPRMHFNGNSEQCPTCFEYLAENEEVICLNCSGQHKYHPDCIIPWLRKSVFCPKCRADLRV